jgi:methylase of polypeptide subunit release factors
VNKDCKKYEWPMQVDAVVTDLPWADLELYKWLGRFCVGHLRPGGLLLCQVGTSQMPAVMNILSEAGLTYRWVLAVVYNQTRFCRPFGGWSPGWRPVLVYSHGVADKTPLTSDTYTVPGIRGKAELHDWQQPQEPISHWVGRLTRPGDVVADPFVGSGTVAVACREHGRKFVGTEIDKKAFRVARGRLTEVSQPVQVRLSTS